MKNYLTLIALNFIILGGINSSEEELCREEEIVNQKLVEMEICSQDELDTHLLANKENLRRFEEAESSGDQLTIKECQDLFLAQINQKMAWNLELQRREGTLEVK